MDANGSADTDSSTHEDKSRNSIDNTKDDSDNLDNESRPITDSDVLVSPLDDGRMVAEGDSSTESHLHADAKDTTAAAASKLYNQPTPAPAVVEKEDTIAQTSAKTPATAAAQDETPSRNNPTPSLSSEDMAPSGSTNTSSARGEDCNLSTPPAEHTSAATGEVAKENRTQDSNAASKSDASSFANKGEGGVAYLPVDTEVTGAGVEGGGDIVAVTGGSGFLGQHVVKMLQERAPHVSEIWVLDVKPFRQRLDYRASKPVKSLVGNVADSRFVGQALQGAHSVIHVAGLISWGTFPDHAGMETANVIGTVNVFNACIRNNVSRLVYCSTVDVAVGLQPIIGGNEEETPVPPPDGFMFPGYPETKYQGERVVLNCTRVPRQDGGKLQTVILRANVLYGELDQTYVLNGLKGARQGNGVLRQVGDGKAMFQQAYVGNTAWAFVCADVAMRENPELTAEAFYVPDHTPVQNSFNFMRPYLQARGYRLSDSRLSYPLVHGAVRVAELVAKGLSPVYRMSLPVQSYSVAYINTSIYFSGEKARRLLGYEPVYTPVEARQRSLEYYKCVELDRTEE